MRRFPGEVSDRSVSGEEMNLLPGSSPIEESKPRSKMNFTVRGRRTTGKKKRVAMSSRHICEFQKTCIAVTGDAKRIEVGHKPTIERGPGRKNTVVERGDMCRNDVRRPKVRGNVREPVEEIRAPVMGGKEESLDPHGVQATNLLPNINKTKATKVFREADNFPRHKILLPTPEEIEEGAINVSNHPRGDSN